MNKKNTKHNIYLSKLIILVVMSLAITSHGLATGSENQCHSSAVDVKEVADGIFVRQGHDEVAFEGHNIANIGFIVGDKCVAVIDTGGSRDEGEQIKCTIVNKTSLPICYVINTHVHADHVLGNSAFDSPDITFVGHRNLPTAVALAAPIYAQRASVFEKRKVSPSELTPPSLLVKDQLSLDLGGRELFLFAHNKAHTNNDLSILDSKTSALWLSDLLFMTHTPVISGSIKGWLQTLSNLKEKKVSTVIPGHGPTSADWPTAAAVLIDYLENVKSEVKQAIADGTSLVEVQENLMQENAWGWKLYEEFRRRNIINAYAELEWDD